jgi:hypothetical protein
MRSLASGVSGGPRAPSLLRFSDNASEVPTAFVPVADKPAQAGLNVLHYLDNCGASSSRSFICFLRDRIRMI